MNLKRHIDSKTQELERSLASYLNFSPTDSQADAIYVLARFLLSKKSRCALLIRGYAGTGKTTLMKSLVDFLKNQGQDMVLLAPTGRAAKVLSNYTSQRATTIHKHIYRRTIDADGISRFSLSENRRKNAVFIVDEASMLSDSKGMLEDDLLSDLINHVYGGVGCRLVLLGDNAQLPPVGMAESPALDVEGLIDRFDLVMAQCVLTDVVRQSQESAILSLATAIRSKIFNTKDKSLEVNYTLGKDVVHISSADVPDVLEECYGEFGVESVRVICRSNKSANQFNHQIRNHVFQMDEQLCAGELLMVVKNNYLWLDESSKMPFIANGEMCELNYMKNAKELYGHQFATLGISFPDNEQEPGLECNALVDTLEINGPSVPEETMKELYTAVRQDLSYDAKSPVDLRSKLQKDPWYNALQIKYGYAVTCHKAQGGQWPVVFIDRGYLKEDMMNKEYWRWLYTAVTRATHRLYLIGF